MESLFITPTEISFITTNQCTAACANCCFQCNPKNKDRISLAEMKQYVDDAISSYSTVKLLVLTGGECFILGNDLNCIVKYATEKKLVVRVVTNGFWANTYEKAFEKLKKLVEDGLTEINFSTGDEHQEFVPFDNIINGIIASLELNLTVVVNIELSDNSSFNLNDLKNDVRLEKYKDRIGKDLIIMCGRWIPFFKEQKKKRESNKNVVYVEENKNRCASLFRTISISPTDDVYACCGLPVKYISYLRLGTLKKYSLQYLYEYQFQDFIKIWLYTEGPKKILNFILNKRNEELIDTNKWHICQICAEIFKCEENIITLQQNYGEVFSNVMFKYELLKRKHLKIINKNIKL